MYLPSYALYPGSFWQDTVGGTPAGVGNFVGAVEMGVDSLFWSAPSSATDRRPTLASDGAVQFGTISAIARYLRLVGGEAYAKVMHEQGQCYFMCRWCMDASLGSGTRVFFDTSNLSNAVGIRFTIAGTQALQNAILNGSTTAIGMLTTDLVPDDDLPHVYKAKFDNGIGQCWTQLDHGTKIFGTRTTALGTGNTGVPHIGNRLSVNTPLPGRIYEMWIGTAPPTPEQEAEWDAHNPVGSITGRAVLETPTYRCELEPLYGYSSMQHRHEGYLVIAVEGSEGSVYRLDNNDTFGSVHAVDVGGTPEVLSGTEVWVDGVSQGAVVDGGQYKGQHSVAFRRQVSESGPSFSLDSTITAQGKKFTEDVTITRKNDGEDVILSYPIRAGRNLNLGAYILMDADAAVIASGTVPGDGSDDETGTAAPAAAQFDSTNEKMVLTVLTRGNDYSPAPTAEIFGTPTGRRIYWRSIAVANAAADEVFRFRVETRIYAATSGTWEALAQSELLKILRKPTLMSMHYHGAP